MNFIKKYKNYIAAGIAVIAVLTAAFLWGGNAPKQTEKNSAIVDGRYTEEPKSTAYSEITDTPENSPMVSETSKPETASTEQPIKHTGEAATEENKPSSADGGHLSAEEKVELAQKMASNANDETAEENNEPDNNYSLNTSEAEHPQAVDPNEVEISDKQMTCTLSVRCDTILNNMAWLDKSKIDIVPKDGVIFEEQTVTFYEGESVFNLLKREMKKNKIHMEFVNTPIYNSVYIEGIANLYEFDCGELSGWMYKVNGWFPNYGVSLYQLKPGDRVEMVYTCDMGYDVGGGF